MLEELDKFIVFIEEKYKKLCYEWEKTDLYNPIHQKNKQVKDIVKDNSILNDILNYRLFINQNHLDLKLAFDQLNIKSEIYLNSSSIFSKNMISYIGAKV